MGEVVDFPGETYLDIDPDVMLKATLGKLQKMIIIGEDHEGEAYLATSTSSLADMLLDLENAKIEIMNRYRIQKGYQDG